MVKNQPKILGMMLKFLIFLGMFLAAYFVFVLLGDALGVFDPLPSPDRPAMNTLFESEGPLFLIDPGHGGRDSGAVAQDGTEEKNINLALSGKIGEYLRAAGARVIYSREEDVLLETPGAPTKKTGDVMARVALAKNNPDGIFVSIHINKFPDSRYSGTQLFFSDNDPRSECIAIDLQKSVSDYLQPQNHRQAKKAGSEIFVLDRITTPAVLIECGFLSNPVDLALLKDEAYLERLAFVIAHSLLQSSASLT